MPPLLHLLSLPADFLAELHRELAGRARGRRRKALEEHRARLEELRERRALLLEPPGDGDGDRATATPGQGPQGTPGARLSPLPASGASQPAPGATEPPGKALGGV